MRIFSTDIGMEFGREKCAALILERGKAKLSEAVSVLDESKINSLKEGEDYKHLGAPKAGRIIYQRKKTFVRRVRKVAKSKLRGVNLIIAINTWAALLMMYAGWIVKWSKHEFCDLDVRTLLIMNGGRVRGCHCMFQGGREVDDLYQWRTVPGKQGYTWKSGQREITICPICQIE